MEESDPFVSRDFLHFPVVLGGDIKSEVLYFFYFEPLEVAKDRGRQLFGISFS